MLPSLNSMRFMRFFLLVARPMPYDGATSASLSRSGLLPRLKQRHYGPNGNIQYPCRLLVRKFFDVNQQNDCTKVLRHIRQGGQNLFIRNVLRQVGWQRRSVPESLRSPLPSEYSAISFDSGARC